MSTPFPLEEEAQRDTGQPMWDPWKSPAPPSWYNGFGFTEDTAYLGPIYRLGAMAGSGVALGEQLMGGVARMAGEFDIGPQGQLATPGLVKAGQTIEEDARERLRDMRPTPQTTGAAVQALHSLGTGLTTAIVGSALGGPVGAFAALSTTQGYNAFKDLSEEGVRPSVAGPLAAVRGLIAGAGAVTPMAFGASLIPRLASGAASNVGFGMTGRAIDSVTLRSAGYDELADQEQVFDRAQILTDLALGAGYGGWAHVHAVMSVHELRRAIAEDPTLRDAALVTNLALRDRASSPGIPITPADAAAHVRAHQKALNDLQDGQHVDVAGTGIEAASVLGRGGEPNPEVTDIFVRAVQESGLLEEQEKLEQLEKALDRKIAGEPEPTEPAITHEEGEVGDHYVRSPNGETIARESEKFIQVERSDTAPEAQGQGEGTARLAALADLAAERGKALASDVSVSPGEVGAFRKLEEAGYEVVRNPAEVNQTTGNLVSSTGKPVFEARPREPLETRVATDDGLRAGLEAMKGETGWAEVGGRLLMDADGKVLGRTKWIPRETWWAERPKGLNETQVHAAVNKALRGEKLTKRERAIVEFMADVHDERVQRAGTLAELQNAVPDLDKQPAPAADLTVLASRAGEFDREATAAVLDSWNDDHPETIARVQDELERIIGRGHPTPSQPAEGLRLEPPAAGREEPPRAERAARALDLFGEDRSREQQLADESRRRDLLRSPRGDVSLETGRPDDLFSQSVRQVDLTDQERPFAQELPTGAKLAEAEAPTKGGEKPEAAPDVAGRLADQALEQRPGLKIVELDGSTVPAAAAKLAADEEAARTEQSAPSLFQQLGDCFTRNG